MASAFQDVWQLALHVEKELLEALADRDPTFAKITHFASEFRVTCQNAIFYNFEVAHTADVEGRLWDAHLKINNRFRKLLARFREQSSRKKSVEKRKLEKYYLEFIKSSQRFYRGFIQHLSSHFGGIPQLEKVAQKFNFDNLSAQSPVMAGDALRALVLSSCHATLIRLGDLSRYRETELVMAKARNWGPATGYYDLAGTINPDSGASHNQLAVIALADGNHLSALYHLYRALSAQEPHPSSKGNLELELRKIMSAWAKRELIPREDAGIPGKALTPWFVYLHAQCYKGVDFPEHDELESEVLSQLAVELKERSLEGLHKFCLINIAAEGFTKMRSNEELTHNAPLFFQRINVKTFFTLLQVLLAELERLATEDSENTDMTAGSDKVTAVTRRILPALRHYSSWLLSNSGSLLAQKEEKDTPLSIQITEFWKIYANTLTLLASTFDVTRLPEVEYLLGEDEETLGFKPLINEATVRRYQDTNGQQKPHPGVERSHPNIEMLYRIREFVIDGLDLIVSNKIPIALVDENDKKMFIYQEEGLPPQVYTSPSGHHHTISSTSIEREDIEHANRIGNEITDSRSVFGGSQSATGSVSANMNRIVEGVERLVESDTYESVSAGLEVPGFLSNLPTGNNYETEARFMIVQEGRPYPKLQTAAPVSGLGPRGVSSPSSVVQPPQSYTPRPALPSIPSIWNTDFPSPSDEAAASSPQTRPATARQMNSPVLGRQQEPFGQLASSGGSYLPPQEPTASEIAFRNNILLQQQRTLEPSPSSSPFESSWISPEPVSPYSRFAKDKEPIGSLLDYNIHLHKQPAGPSSQGASWANEAFTASSSRTLFFESSVLDNSPKSAARLGAIGQTPPCGQEG